MKEVGVHCQDITPPTGWRGPARRFKPERLRRCPEVITNDGDFLPRDQRETDPAIARKRGPGGCHQRDSFFNSSTRISFTRQRFASVKEMGRNRMMKSVSRQR